MYETHLSDKTQGRLGRKLQVIDDLPTGKGICDGDGKEGKPYLVQKVEIVGTKVIKGEAI